MPEQQASTRQLVTRAAALGVATGFVYSLSPMTVWFGVAFAGLLAWAALGADEQERRWIWRLLILAVALKTVALAGMFIAKGVFASRTPGFFGDEEYFKKRSLLLRNIALGVKISPEDIIDAYDEYSATSYLYVLAYLQVLFGPSPFGVHLFNWLISFGTAILLYKAVRPTFGSAASLLALTVALFLPTLFVWSTSVLKEPLFSALSSIALVSIVAMLRGGPLWRAAVAIVVCVLASLAAATVRANAIPFIVAGIAGAFAGRFILPRPRLAVALAAAIVVVCAVALMLPSVQDRLLYTLRMAAYSHRGYVNTAGNTYRLLAEEYYGDRSVIAAMPMSDGLLFAGRALVSYILVPLPWQIRSTDAVLFIPEQMIWYTLLAVSPIGIVAGLRRDPTITAALVGYSIASAAAVALSSGNIGTLVRHRGITITYLVWLSALGLCEALRIVLRSRSAWRAANDTPQRSLHATY